MRQYLPERHPARLAPPEYWQPVTADERRIAAALILAGGPVTNGELAHLMGVSPGEASKTVKALGDVVRKERDAMDARTVRISIPALQHHIN